MFGSSSSTRSAAIAFAILAVAASSACSAFKRYDAGPFEVDVVFDVAHDVVETVTDAEPPPDALDATDSPDAADSLGDATDGIPRADALDAADTPHAADTFGEVTDAEDAPTIDAADDSGPEIDTGACVRDAGTGGDSCCVGSGWYCTDQSWCCSGFNCQGNVCL